MRETMVINQICHYLHEKKYFFWRQNNTGVYDPSKKTFRRMPQFSLKGIPDIFATQGSITWALEVKTEKGSQSIEQKVFEALWKFDPYRKYAVVRSEEDVIKLGL